MSVHDELRGSEPLNDKPFEHTSHRGTTFKCQRCDFAAPITISGPLSMAVLEDLAEMIGWHAVNIRPELNGFAGYDCITLNLPVTRDVSKEFEDAMQFLDEKGVLRGNGEDEFTLLGRLQGVWEGNEGSPAAPAIKRLTTRSEGMKAEMIQAWRILTDAMQWTVPMSPSFEQIDLTRAATEAANLINTLVSAGKPTPPGVEKLPPCDHDECPKGACGLPSTDELLALFIGWRKLPRDLQISGIPVEDSMPWVDPDGVRQRSFPRYSSDLNLIKQIEDRLTPAQWERYVEVLSTMWLAGGRATLPLVSAGPDAKAIALQEAVASAAPSTPAKVEKSLRKDIEHAINHHSMENGSDTPDFILAGFLTDCLTAFDTALQAREKWYGREVSGKSDYHPAA